MAPTNAVKAGQGAAASTPIDMEHLASQTMGDEGLRDEVLRLYADMSGVYLSRIQQSVETPQLLEHLHTLRSAAAGIGAIFVRERTREVEDALRADGAVDPARLLGIAAAVAECQAFIHDLIGPA